MAKFAQPVEARTKLHVLQFWFGWIIVILMLLSIITFSNGQVNINLNTSLLSILMLGILSIISGKRR
jgi:hypothetical protein